MGVRHINPEGLPSNPAYSQAVVVEQPAKTIYIGGQNGVGPDGALAGTTLGEQAAQALRNLRTILESEGATLANIVHWRIAMAEGQAFEEGYAAFQEIWDTSNPPPAITGQIVSGLARGYLVEIDAVAVL
ncbi:RidA family protein [Actinomadura rupiterrae]|uniref:RidA family protein n=1 Tax=Actinomadura rupiterrae TaxID=559627 RepID=UPI0020A32B09|nr:RidA family protein [Actinomadura rupiterrae]MCP2341253.1 enamine deaminase RidA (YjgF/YER057c/UK114 family) [Actinomadura rupiterrae]